MEQEGEHIHHRLKDLEKKYLNVRNKGERFFMMIRDIENEYACDFTIFEKHKRGPNKKKL